MHGREHMKQMVDCKYLLTGQPALWIAGEFQLDPRLPWVHSSNMLFGEVLSGNPGLRFLFQRVLGVELRSKSVFVRCSAAGECVFDSLRCHGQLEKPGAGGIEHGVGDQGAHTDDGRLSTPLRR